MNDVATPPLYSKDALPADFEAPGGHSWAEFVKTATTRAIRIDGPFRVETSESENEPFFCEDGWLAIDARGYPYAIADDEFRQIYVPAAPEEEPVGIPDGWQGQEPASGTRRQIVRDALRGFYTENPGVELAIDALSLALADRVEAALQAVEPAQTSPGEGGDPTPQEPPAAAVAAGSIPGSGEIQRPSIGRIVVYREFGPTSEAASDPTGVPTQDSPAIVCGVHEDGTTVDLVAFSPQGGTFGRTEVPLSGGSPAAATIGDEPAMGTWRWPERV